MFEAKIRRLIQEEMENYRIAYNVNAQGVFLTNKWEVGTRFHSNSSVPICRPAGTGDSPGRHFGYYEQVTEIKLSDLILKLMDHCGLEFKVTPKKDSELTIVKRGE